jgi:signal transduction histidine kinase
MAFKDNGKGIPEEALPYIFERFYRAEQSRNSSTGGSGLGLAIARQIIDGHGGFIWADSMAGEGTTIYIQLKRLMDKGE